MARQYQQLTIKERETIQMGLWERKSLRFIAFELNRSVSTIFREIKRNCPPERRSYAPRASQERAVEKIKKRGKRPRLKCKLIREYAIRKLKEDYSPEQISGRLKIDHPGYSISPESIYRFIYVQYQRNGYGQCIGEDLRIYLKRKHKVRKPKYIPFKEEKGRIKNRVFIDERPKEAEERIKQGHWEGDSMGSRKSLTGLNTLVERVSGIALITKIQNTTSAETKQTVIKRFKKVSVELRKTLTVDNGHENAEHEEIEKAINIQIFFAHPYHSWERGTNENTNGLIRWYLPKGTDFAKISNERIKDIEYRLNTRPRKRLGWRTPLEVFNHGVALKC